MRLAQKLTVVLLVFAVGRSDLFQKLCNNSWLSIQHNLFSFASYKQFVLLSARLLAFQLQSNVAFGQIVRSIISCALPLPSSWTLYTSENTMQCLKSHILWHDYFDSAHWCWNNASCFSREDELLWSFGTSAESQRHWAWPETEAYLWTLFDFCAESLVYVLFKSSPADQSSCPHF